MRLIAELPHHKGSYGLLLHSDRAVTCQIGSLGEQEFAPGDYIYTGSAFGPGGVHGRVQHHVRIGGSYHWHIDYLMPYVNLKGVLYSLSPLPKECVWVSDLLEMRGAAPVIKGFGSSDCRSKCFSHLIYFKETVTTRMIWHHLSSCAANGTILCDYVDPITR